MGPPHPLAGTAGVHRWWALCPTVPDWVGGPWRRRSAETANFSQSDWALQPGHRGSEKAHPLCPELSPETGTSLPGYQEQLPANQLGAGVRSAGRSCRAYLQFSGQTHPAPRLTGCAEMGRSGAWLAVQCALMRERDLQPLPLPQARPESFAPAAPSAGHIGPEIHTADFRPPFITARWPPALCWSSRTHLSLPDMHYVITHDVFYLSVSPIGF